MKIVLFILLVLFQGKGYAQSAATYNYSSDTNNITFYDMVPDGNCGQFALGFTTPLYQLFITRLNETGDTLWTTALDFEPYQLYPPYGHIEKGDDGIYYISGRSFIPPQSNIFYNIIGKLDFNGNLLWSKSIEGYFYNFNLIKVINNKLYCSLIGASADTLKLFKFDSNGNEIWKKGIVSQPSFMAASIETIEEDTTGFLNLTGTMSGYANGAILGNFMIKMDSFGNIISSSRTHSISNQELFGCTGAYNDFKGNIYIANYGEIRFQKINTNTGTILSKLFYLDSLHFFPKHFFTLEPDKFIITGNINNTGKSFQISLDTSLSILSAVQYSSTDTLNISLSKTLFSCNSFTSLGTIINNQRQSGYIIKKENINDSVCFQSNLIVRDSLVYDTIENLSVTEYPTVSWSTINAISGHLQLIKNSCSFLDAIQENDLSSELAIFPNPASQILNIITQANYMKISIYNLQGQEILHKTYSKQININSLPIGIYVLELRGRKGLARKKFIKY